MPIHPALRHHYGKEWKTIIRPRIRRRATVTIDRADGETADAVRCECLGECGIDHEGADARCPELDREPARTFSGQVIIGVAHRDQDPRNVADTNLVCLCQACHNRMDAPARLRHAAVERAMAEDAEAEAAGQGRLFQPHYKLDDWRVGLTGK